MRRGKGIYGLLIAKTMEVQKGQPTSRASVDCVKFSVVQKWGRSVSVTNMHTCERIGVRAPVSFKCAYAFIE